MKHIISHSPLAVLMLGAALATACHDDKGNYEYSDLDIVRITVPDDGSGRTGYVIDRGDRLVISPEIYYNGSKVINDKDAPLSYLWTFYTNHTAAGIDYTIDTLARTRNLDVQINRIGGSYTALLTVTNTTTGIETYYHADCQVEETLTAGWMVLYERADRPGTSDVGLVVNPLNKKNVVKNKDMWNIYSSSNNDEPLAGLPLNIFHEALPLQSTGNPRILTTDKMVMVSPNDFTKIADENDLFYGAVPRGFKYLGPTIRSSNMSEALITADDHYHMLAGTNMGIGSFGDAKRNDAQGTVFAAWGSQMTNGVGMESVVYDQTNCAFYYTVKNYIDLYSFAEQDMEASKFDVNDMDGFQLLFGDFGSWTPAGGNDIMLFGKDNRRFIAEANFKMTGTLNNIGLTWEDVSSSPEILNATSFATNGLGRYAYYGAGNKVYDVTYDNGRTTVVWTAPTSTEVVTCIKTHKYYYAPLMAAMLPNLNEVVHIATWDASKNQGKLYEYKINSGSGALLTDEASYEYTVPGKVKDMAFKYEMAE